MNHGWPLLPIEKLPFAPPRISGGSNAISSIEESGQAQE